MKAAPAAKSGDEGAEKSERPTFAGIADLADEFVRLHGSSPLTIDVRFRAAGVGVPRFDGGVGRR
ncbi:hypothetical protein K9U39_08730 [Rhodoblastus acidophilus]|uniref:Uncharacterized protein n=1 Tax=Candidatus Rhodoblastus alkanivorans TaxID=2954117 RepID=A0ABS9Z7R9_9HYPH|nr:hypothetical protein [Candidatus Rhodoblastus alkanivorans]MCI4678931.1 hypothetical protein [Candidatus Rhodoblastus alkanivorans]MCI4683709.1 hypothetical protein [Candidatus Rhodoblastus alkanivorans]MDI4641026.1 hypothetical protein [Rhodoblastus acidophilus]